MGAEVAGNETYHDPLAACAPARTGGVSFIWGSTLPPLGLCGGPDKGGALGRSRRPRSPSSRPAERGCQLQSFAEAVRGDRRWAGSRARARALRRGPLRAARWSRAWKPPTLQDPARGVQAGGLPRPPLQL